MIKEVVHSSDILEMSMKLRNNYLVRACLNNVKHSSSTSNSSSENFSFSPDSTIAQVTEEMTLDKHWAENYLSSLSNKLLFTAESVSSESASCESMEVFMKQRSFNGWNSSPPATRMLSSLLTFPLTMAYAINKIFKNDKKKLNVLLLGARSESSLPIRWWSECLHACSATELQLTMLGPGLQAANSQLSTIISTKNCVKEIKINNLNLCRLHDHPNSQYLISNNELIVLFNPGLGSPSQQIYWEPTLKMLLQSKKQVLCTALGEYDMNRDLNVIRRISESDDFKSLGVPIEFSIAPLINPFKSSRRIVDKNETKEASIVTTNHYIYAFQTN